jgi:hypothetical protein
MKIGLVVRAVHEPKKVKNTIKIKRQQRYISHMRGGGTPVDGMMKPGTFVELPDVINRVNFHLFDE